MLQRIELNTPQLRDLDLNDCLSLRLIQGQCPELEQLNVSSCRSLEAGSLVTFVRDSCGKTLQVLKTIGLMQLQAGEVLELLDACSSLREFNVNGCKALPPETIEAVEQHLLDVQASERVAEKEAAGIVFDALEIQSWEPVPAAEQD
eukprot:GABV01001807.1.p2 GENE.GABV01001807.1~~GABV01001807.1.p2  ORF type:complete len:147 (-),score=55.34 GABV01001807.1:7-447(-)